MKLTFLGAAQTVTGSKYLIESNGRRILVDCGLFQGLKELRLRNWEEFPVRASSIDAVVLTHAHLDHTGYLPALVKQGFRGTIFASSGTRDLCKLILPDSARLQEEEAEYANRRGYSKHKPAQPLYSEEDAAKALTLFRAVRFDAEYDLPGGMTGLFRPSGHILGSAFATLSDGKATVTFSGDLGRPHDLLMKPPVKIRGSDYLVVESTYGDRIHENVDLIGQMEAVVGRALGRGGVIVIPAFAVGRSQALLYCLYRLKSEKRIPDVPIYLNSPMSINASGVFCDHLGEHRLSPEECEGTCEVSHYVRTVEESKSLNRKRGPMILISASGMATGGRVLHHLKAFAPDPRNMIVLVGFQSAGTRGASLAQGARTLKIHGEQVPVEAEVDSVHGLSGHADQKEIMSWLSGFETPPRQTFVTHGEPGPARILSEKIREALGWNVSVPNYMDQVELK